MNCPNFTEYVGYAEWIRLVIRSFDKCVPGAYL